MIIRRARNSELAALARMDSKIFGDASSAQALKVLRHCARSLPSACLVAEADGKIRGAIFAQKRISFSPASAYISSFFVAKGFRGKGIGKSLLKTCLKEMRRKGIRSVSLTVERTNDSALSLYKKSGFKLFRLLYLKELD